MSNSDTGMKARRRAGIWAVRMIALAALAVPAGAWAARPSVAPALLSQSKIFGLGEVRRVRALPLRIAALTPVVQSPQLGADPTPPLAPRTEARDLLGRVLSLREDLRVLVNQGIKDVRQERITLGLRFARAF